MYIHPRVHTLEHIHTHTHIPAYPHTHDRVIYGVSHAVHLPKAINHKRRCSTRILCSPKPKSELPFALAYTLCLHSDPPHVSTPSARFGPGPPSIHLTRRTLLSVSALDRFSPPATPRPIAIGFNIRPLRNQPTSRETPNAPTSDPYEAKSVLRASGVLWLCAAGSLKSLA